MKVLHQAVLEVPSESRNGDGRDLVALGKSARQRGDREAALVFFQQATAAGEHSASVEAFLQMAAELLSLNRVSEAEKTYAEIECRNPADVRALLGLGQCARRRGDRETALSCFQRAMAANTAATRLEPGIEAAVELAALGRFAEAEGLYNEILCRDPANLRALLGLGRCARGRGDRDAAFTIFQRAVVANSNGSNFEPQLEAAAELRVLGRIPEAVELYDELAVRDPDDVRVLLGLGQCARRRGERAAALGFFERAMAASKATGRFEPRLEAAGELCALGRIREADQIYSEVGAKDPENVRALLGLGQCARTRGERDAALAFFQRADAANKIATRFEPRLEVAAELCALARILDAEGIYREIIAQDGGCARALIGLGDCARRRGEGGLALALFRQAAMKSNLAMEFAPHLTWAAELRVQDRLPEAEGVYRSIIDKMANPVAALVGLGQCARQQGKHEQALAYFEDAAARSVNGDLPPALAAVNELSSLGRFEEAERRGHALHVRHPDLAAPLSSLARVARAAGRHRIALERFQRAAAIAAEAQNQSEALSAQLEIAAELRTLGRPQEAASICELCLSTNASNPRVLLAAALCYRQLGRREAALSSLVAATVLDPLNANLKMQVALLKRESGETDQALAILDEIEQMSPGNTGVRLERARIYSQQGRLADSLAALQHGGSPMSTRPDAQLEIARLSLALGRPEEARDCAQRLVEGFPNDTGALEFLATLASSAMELVEAEDILRRATSISPGRLSTQLALAALLRQVGRLDEAIASLDNCAAIVGESPGILTQRVVVLQAMGRWQEALELARAGMAETPWHMGLWERQLRLEWINGDEEAIELCLSASPANTVHERAQWAHLQGLDARSRWNLESAISHQHDALRLNPRHGGALYELARLSLLNLDIDTTREMLRRSAVVSSATTRLQERSSNISQTHTGQLVDEFRIDATLLERLRSLQGDAPAQRVEQLLPILLRHPKSTAAAAMLLVALRQSGLFDRPRVRGEERVPHRIIQFWDSIDVPDDVSALCQTWEELNPTYTYRLFDERSAGKFLLENVGADVCLAFARAREPAQKADIFRLAYLAVCGGVYVDCDDRCLAPLDEWMPSGPSFVGYMEEFGTLGNNFLAAEAGSPVILHALKDSVAALNRGDSDVLWLSTGPGVVTRAFAKVLAEQADYSSALNIEFAVIDRDALLRVNQFHSRTAYKSTGRHWLHTALGRNRVATTSRQMELIRA